VSCMPETTMTTHAVCR